MIAIRITVLLSLVVLGGCGSGSNDSAGEPARIFDSQRDALDRSKSVQDTVLDAAQQRRAEED
jgi:hypothetical protein